MADLEPGPELDALVAEKVMGWVIKRGSWVDIFCPWIRGSVQLAGGPEHKYIRCRRAEISSIYKGQWSPTTSIADAWEVVEKLQPKTFDLSGYNPHRGAQWEARFWRNDIQYHEADSDTAPHAICLAALKAVGHEIDQPRGLLSDSEG